MIRSTLFVAVVAAIAAAAGRTYADAEVVSFERGTITLQAYPAYQRSLGRATSSSTTSRSTWR
jgi:hypothetical protein